MAQICLVFIAVFAYKDTKKYPFQKIYLLAELVHFFLTTRLLYIFTFSLGGSTEPPEPPLDPPQSVYVPFCPKTPYKIILFDNFSSWFVLLVQQFLKVFQNRRAA